MRKQGSASKLQRALSAPRSGTRPSSILDGCRQMLAIALQRAKGRDGGKSSAKQFVGQRQKLLFEIESEHAEEVSKTFMRATRSLRPRQNVPCLNLGVRKRKRAFSLGGICDPVFYFPFGGRFTFE